MALSDRAAGNAGDEHESIGLCQDRIWRQADRELGNAKTPLPVDSLAKLLQAFMVLRALPCRSGALLLRFVWDSHPRQTAAPHRTGTLKGRPGAANSEDEP